MNYSEYYHNLNSISEDGELRITMEHYAYNIWALISIVIFIIIVKNTNAIYLYNFFLIIMMVFIFAMYKILKRENK